MRPDETARLDQLEATIAKGLGRRPNLNEREARVLTDSAKADAQALWRKLVELHERNAHGALGFASWHTYCAEEFDLGKSRAYQILEAGRVAGLLTGSTMVEPPSTERVARELAPLRAEPEEMRKVWVDVVERNGDTPTAADVRVVVQERTRGQLSNQTGGSDEWATPQAFFDLLDAEFNFSLDVCALASSAKCERYFTPESDGLAQEWTGTCWMNPPYGESIGRWVAKAHATADAGATVVCLVPARVDTGWWWDHCRYAEIRFLRGRLKFGVSANSAPFPSAVVIFGRPAVVKWWER